MDKHNILWIENIHKEENILEYLTLFFRQSDISATGKKAKQIKEKSRNGGASIYVSCCGYVWTCLICSSFFCQLTYRNTQEYS